MRFWTPLFLCSTLVLAGCGDRLRNSTLNPGNWFGGSRSAPVSASGGPEKTNPLIPKRNSVLARVTETYAGTAVSEVADFRVERRPGGAVIIATGLADGLGYFDAKLVPDETSAAGVLSYTLSAVRPEVVTASPTQAARQIIVATAVTDQELKGIRRIVVRAQTNERSVRR